MKPNILAVVILYNQNLTNSETYKSFISKSSLPLFIYDNSPYQQYTQNDLDNDIFYFHDKNNSGLSKAYNMAAKYAKNKNCDWILLLDQDTTFPDLAYNYYIQSIIDYPELKLFAPIIKINSKTSFSPAVFRFKRASAAKGIKSGKYLLKKIAPVNTGLLINTDAFIDVGGYNERVYLDFADYQFIERFSKKYPYFHLIDLTCIQDFSNKETNSEKLNNRFKIYCNCAKAYEKETIYDKICFLYIVIRRTIALTLRTQKLIFFKTFVKNYIQ